MELMLASGREVANQTAGGPGEPKGQWGHRPFPVSSTAADYSEEKAKVKFAFGGVQVGGQQASVDDWGPEQPPCHGRASTLYRPHTPWPAKLSGFGAVHFKMQMPRVQTGAGHPHILLHKQRNQENRFLNPQKRKPESIMAAGRV